MTRTLLLLALVLAGVAAFHPGPVRVEAVSATTFWLLANFSGWNSTAATGPVNPTITQFRGEVFTANIEHDDTLGVSHNFAVYTRGFPPSGVNPLTDVCSLTNSNGCLKKSATVTAPTALSTIFTFTPTIPPDDFSGTGTYEYYCQFHAFSMHRQLIIYKTPDLDNDGSVNIIDIATMALAFGSTPASPTWNIAADIDNEGHVNIIDIATAAFYYGKTV